MGGSGDWDTVGEVDGTVELSTGGEGNRNEKESGSLMLKMRDCTLEAKAG